MSRQELVLTDDSAFKTGDKIYFPSDDEFTRCYYKCKSVMGNAINIKRCNWLMNWWYRRKYREGENE